MTHLRTDLSLSLLALAGIAALGVSLSLRGMGRDDPLGRRFRFALCVTGVIFAARACVDIFPLGVFATVLRLAAASLPLAVVLVAEGLLRRHATSWIKRVTIWGTALGLAVALWPSGPDLDVEDILLLLWQVAGFGMAGVMILRRDKASLTAGENALVRQLSVSLLCLAGVAAFDFLTPLWHGQVRVGVLGVLVLCWIAIDATRGTKAFLREGSLVAVTTCVAALAWPDIHAGQGVVMLSALLVGIIWMRVLGQRTHGGGEFAADIAQEALDRDAIHARIMGHPLMAEAVALPAGALLDSDIAMLQRLATTVPLVWPDHPALTAPEAEQVRHLCHVSGATHLIALGPRPAHWRGLSLPALATDRRALGELSLLARLAQNLGVSDKEHRDADA